MEDSITASSKTNCFATKSTSSFLLQPPSEQSLSSTLLSSTLELLLQSPSPIFLTPLHSAGSTQWSSQTKTGWNCPAQFLNPNWPAKKAGKKKVQMEGFSRFARLYGRQSAAVGRLPSKSVIFRPAAVALADSELSESDSSTRSYLLKEAQATVILGKELGINFGGQEEGVIDKILELERKDKERYLKDGTA